MVGATNNDIHRDMGKLEAEVTGVKDRMTRLETVVKEGFDKIEAAIGSAAERSVERHEGLEGRMRNVEDREQRRKGAWGIFVAMAGTIGGLVAWLVQKLVS